MQKPVSINVERVVNNYIDNSTGEQVRSESEYIGTKHIALKRFNTMTWMEGQLILFTRVLKSPQENKVYF